MNNFDNIEHYAQRIIDYAKFILESYYWGSYKQASEFLSISEKSLNAVSVKDCSIRRYRNKRKIR